MGIHKMRNVFSLMVMVLATFQGAFAITSPDGKINVEKAEGGLQISYTSQPVMFYNCGDVKTIVNKGRSVTAYEMKMGKRRHCKNEFSEVDVNLLDGKTVSLRIYDDGVAWKSDGPSKVETPWSTHSWIQTWCQPYEDFYNLDRKIEAGDRMAFPALFEYPGEVFMLLTESNIGKESAGASIYGTNSYASFDIVTDKDGDSAWVTAIIGKLGEIVESTLVTDNSEKCLLEDTTWITPGVASWVYWAYNHGSKDYDIVRKYIDMAIKLKLEYVLIDAEWDEMQGEHNIVELLEYANSNGVKPMIWYNSSVGWIEGAPGPKFRLNDPQKREEEFAWCEANGVKGVKIDFFSGDDNKNMKYMIQLLESAARHHLLVNFHGATLPRGWQRTYPNLVSTEGVYGAEWYNNVPTFTNVAARHNATLPFTRNVVGSMDYTPCAFSDSQHPHITSNAHELALTVLYESGIQHIADRPESIYAQPYEVQDFISELPAAWDNTYFLGGYPGDYVMLARESDGKLYIAGINGSDENRTVELDTKKLNINKNICNAKMFADGDEASWRIEDIKRLPQKITLKPRGGFAIKVEK